MNIQSRPSTGQRWVLAIREPGETVGSFMCLQRGKYVPWIEHGDVVEGMESGARLSGFELCHLGHYLTSSCFSFLI